MTDFNKQFKPQMEVVDVVGPTWDRALNRETGNWTAERRISWLGPQTRAFVKRRRGRARYSRDPESKVREEVERKITEMEKERVQLMVDDFSLEKC